MASFHVSLLCGFAVKARGLNWKEYEETVFKTIDGVLSGLNEA
jgi:hypothetical protein